MRRLHLFEIEDQSWCPAFLRDAMTDYLQHVILVTRPYHPIAGRLEQALLRAGAQEVVDLCSGGGGPWLSLQPALQNGGKTITVCLTDRYPNLAAFERVQAVSQNRIGFTSEPVDATQVPPEQAGFRTLFSSFHHFRPEQARAILGDAVRHRQGIGIFEATQRRLPVILLGLLIPFMVLIFTPAIHPFRWSRILFTYLIPILPFMIMFDGMVSCLRTYTPAELNAMTEAFADAEYTWEVGEEKDAKSPVPVTYLIGTPARSAED